MILEKFHYDKLPKGMGDTHAGTYLSMSSKTLISLSAVGNMQTRK